LDYSPFYILSFVSDAKGFHYAQEAHFSYLTLQAGGPSTGSPADICPIGGSASPYSRSAKLYKNHHHSAIS
jgi:hypothetical protein